jgi:hypothetical protein
LRDVTPRIEEPSSLTRNKHAPNSELDTPIGGAEA